MFKFGKKEPEKVFNPLNACKDSVIEFNIGQLRNTGLYRFNKIIEFSINDKKYSRYIIYSKADNTEFVLEVFPGNAGQVETYLYSLTDTIPFSEEFLDVAGQKYLTTPDGTEYQRCVLPDDENRIDGTAGRIKIYNLETEETEKETSVKLWDYKREIDGRSEFLNIEMNEDTGMFRIFVGELIENIFYKFYQNSK